MSKRYALVGTGKRARHFLAALIEDHADHAELVALCDASDSALAAERDRLRGLGADVPGYVADDFDRMIAQAKPDVVIVTSPDFTHAEYVCRAMELGCDAVVEKPLTIDDAGCRRIAETQERTGRSCRVTMNYRYSPWNTAIKETLMAGTIGRVVSVNMRKSFRADRGASFFHRWHAESKNSGGILVHKGTHYFDLMNFFLGDVPRRITAAGGRNFFTPDVAQRLGLADHGPRCGDCSVSERCPYRLDYRRNGVDAATEARGKQTGYYGDLCVFRPEADIADTIHALIEYENGVACNYLLVMNGTGDSDTVLYGTHGKMTITGPALHVEPYYGEPYDIHPPKIAGHHGGADPVMFNDIFNPQAPADPYLRAADHHAGAFGILVGIAATRSMESGEPVLVRDLVPGLQTPELAPNADEPDGFTTVQMRDWVQQGKWV